MMRWLWKWAVRLVVLTFALVTLLLAPVARTELACVSEPRAVDYASILPPEHRRPESRTLLTYPEWHIVHAYDDYAQVIAQGDPHDFGYLQSISGFWSSLCALSGASANHGGFDWETKQTIYVIGVSFTAELLAKAVYEETLGRIATMMRGDNRSALDDLSAGQARAYATFLQQTPWYKWDFEQDIFDLLATQAPTPRDAERQIALGLEYHVKSAYARLIAQAVAQVGADELRLRMVVRGIAPEELAAFEGVEVIAERPEGVEIETPRYRILTHLLADMAGQGADFVEIAGNDDILLTALSSNPATADAIHSFPRQGYGDTRHLILIKVSDLASWLRNAASSDLTLEHIHDY